MYRTNRESQALTGKTMDCNKITARNSLFVYVPGQYLRKKKTHSFIKHSYTYFFMPKKVRG